jgi:hypothetical protein
MTGDNGDHEPAFAGDGAPGPGEEGNFRKTAVNQFALADHGGFG